MKQKFHKGNRVYIGKMPKYMSHFQGEVMATVIGSYSDLCAGSGDDQYSLDIDGHGTHSWYDEDQLTRVYTTEEKLEMLNL